MLDYTAGSTKGGVNRGQLFNGTYALGEVTPERSAYTGNAVVESITHAAGGTETLAFSWKPVYGSVKVTSVDGQTTLEEGTDYDLTYTTNNEIDKRWTKDTVNGATTSSALLTNSVDIAPNDTPVGGVAITGIQFKAASQAAAGNYKVAYLYDNIVVPQNDIPQLNAELKEITLTAHARRIAVYYSQIANFQAKTDYGFDLGENLAKQAMGELQFEIDSEIVDGLAKAVDPATTLRHTWSRTPGIGVSVQEHYAGFARLFDELATEIYLATRKFEPNYMVCARDVVTVLQFLNGWNAAPKSTINGPYYAGNYNGVKVFVSPQLAPGAFFVGVNGSDLQTSAAVYGVYMPIVPTQLLGFADGAMSQGLQFVA